MPPTARPFLSSLLRACAVAVLLLHGALARAQDVPPAEATSTTTTTSPQVPLEELAPAPDTPPPAPGAPPAEEAPLEELAPATTGTPSAPRASAAHDPTRGPAAGDLVARVLGASVEGGVGAVVALAANFAVPVLVFGVLMTPVALFTWMTLQQDNNGWEGIIAVLVATLGGIFSGAVALASAPVGAALAFVAGVTVAAAVRAVVRLATVGPALPDTVDLLVPLLGVAAALPTLLLACVLMGAAAALIPLTFTITNTISIGELPAAIFPGILVAGAGLGVGALVLDMLLGLTARTALYVVLRTAAVSAAHRLAQRSDSTRAATE